MTGATGAASPTGTPATTTATISAEPKAWARSGRTTGIGWAGTTRTDSAVGGRSVASRTITTTIAIPGIRDTVIGTVREVATMMHPEMTTGKSRATTTMAEGTTSGGLSMDSFRTGGRSVSENGSATMTGGPGAALLATRGLRRGAADLSAGHGAGTRKTTGDGAVRSRIIDR